jgi:hypothetical protein
MSSEKSTREAPAGQRIAESESPTDRQLEQAKHELGLPNTPRYRVPTARMRKFKRHWPSEPIAIAGRKA